MAIRGRLCIPSDGSHSPSGGADTIYGANSPTGTFAGRFVRIVNNSDAPYNPQIAEVEVYGGSPPQIRSFTAEPDAIHAGGSSVLRWQITGAASATLAPSNTAVNPTGETTVRPDSTTTYTLSASNDAGTSTATVTVGVDVELDPPEISEFMADNQSTLKDEEGDNSDWIEIHNPNEFSISLDRYF